MNEFFHYDQGSLYCEEIAVNELAKRFGTPLYIYSANAFRKRYRELAQAFSKLDPLICYSVKACSNLSILKLLKEEGSGFDCVSKGEILRCLEVGVDPQRIVFAGVGKTPDEIAYALENDILMFNVESENELQAIASVAQGQGKPARIALRLNPDVDPKTHRYISTGKKENKFGIDLDRAQKAFESIKASEHLQLRGVHLHIGSQMLDNTLHAQAISRVHELLAQAKSMGFELEFINVGGGFGIDYHGGESLPPSAFAENIVPAVESTGLRMVMEPGRYIAGNSGILLTQVVYLKKSGHGKTFAIVDGAMNDLLRPSIYDAYHRVWPVKEAYRELPEEEGVVCDVVGPICESGDFFAKDRRLPQLQEGELIAVFSTGAYGFTMASNYNTRPRPSEVLVEGQEPRLIRSRESYDDLLQREREALKQE